MTCRSPHGYCDQTTCEIAGRCAWPTKEEAMREKELRETAECAICGKAHGHVGVPIFYRVRVRQYGVDLNTVRRQDGLTAMLGGHAGLAAVMGPDAEMAKVLGEAERTICGECIIKPQHLLLIFGKEP